MSQAIIKSPGLTDYDAVLKHMRALTECRTQHTADQIWFLQHLPVYTLGLNADKSHILEKNLIPVVQSDRGGQVTYHGPGQLVVYLLLDLHRLNIRVREYVYLLEQVMIDLCNMLSIDAYRRTGAPGVYVEDKKIGALGVRVKKGCCYHGIAINVDMDLSPFSSIHPCGYQDLEVTQLSMHGFTKTIQDIPPLMVPLINHHLGLPSLDPNVYQEKTVFHTTTEAA